MQTEGSLLGEFSSPDQREHRVQTEGSLLGDRRKYPCGIRGMSLKTSGKTGFLIKIIKFLFSSPCGAVRRSTYLASGNEFKNIINSRTRQSIGFGLFSSPDQREHRVQTEGSLLGDRRKCPCGIRGMSLKTL